MSWKRIKSPSKRENLSVRVSCFCLPGRSPNLAIILDDSAMLATGIAIGRTVTARLGIDEHAGQLWLVSDQRGDWSVDKVAGGRHCRIVVPAPEGFTTKFEPVSVAVEFEKPGLKLVLPDPVGSACGEDPAPEKQARSQPPEADEKPAGKADTPPAKKPETVADLPRRGGDDPAAEQAADPLDLRKVVCALPAPEKAHMDKAQKAFWTKMRKGAAVNKLELSMLLTPPLPLSQVAAVLRALSARVKPYGGLLRSDGELFRFVAGPVQAKPNQADKPRAPEAPDDSFAIPDAAYQGMKPIQQRFFDAMKGGRVVPISELQTLRDDPMTVVACVAFVNTLRKLVDRHGLIIQKIGEAYQMQSFDDEVARAAS